MLPPTGCVPADRQDECADDEHCGCHQGLDAYILLLLPLPRTRHHTQPGGVHILLQVSGRGVMPMFDQQCAKLYEQRWTCVHAQSSGMLPALPLPLSPDGLPPAAHVSPLLPPSHSLVCSTHPV